CDSVPPAAGSDADPFRSWGIPQGGAVPSGGVARSPAERRGHAVLQDGAAVSAAPPAVLARGARPATARRAHPRARRSLPDAEIHPGSLRLGHATPGFQAVPRAEADRGPGRVSRRSGKRCRRSARAAGPARRAEQPLPCARGLQTSALRPAAAHLTRASEAREKLDAPISALPAL